MPDMEPARPVLSYAAIAERLLAHCLAQPGLTKGDDAPAVLRKAFHAFAAVLALDHAAAAGRSPREMLSDLVTGLVEATQSRAARVILKTAAGTLTPLESIAAPDQQADWSDSVTTKVVADGTARTSAKAAGIDLPEGMLPSSLACAGVVRHDGEIVGAIQLFGKRSGPFGADDLALATSTGAYIAELAVKAGLLPWLAENVKLVPLAAAATGSESRPSDAILGRLLTVALEILSADRGWILFYDPPTDELYTAISEGLTNQQLRISSQDGIAGAAFRTGELINVPLAYQDPRFNPAVDAKTGYRTRSILCTPIYSSDGQRLGVLQVFNKRRGSFDDSDESHLKSLASQMGVTRDYTALFEQVRRMQSHNESMLRSLTNGVVTVDTRGEITFVNPAALATLRRANELELLGLPLLDVFGEMNGWIKEAIEEVANGRAEKHLPNSEIYVESLDDWVLANVGILPLLDDAQNPLGFMLVIENLERERELRRTMSRYVSNEVIDQLIRDSGANLGGTAQTATTLFADIRSFTSLSESLGAAGTVSMLNEYFSYMEDVLTNHAGLIDKYIGDAVMAVFGLPFPAEADAQNSVLAACDMQQVLELLNTRRASTGGAPLRIGVGIATGTIIAGNIGSPKRMDFTVIGDPVNLASRIESMTKNYGADILICQETRKRLTTTPKMRRIDVVRVRGQTRPTDLYEVLEHRAAQWTLAFDDSIGEYETGLDAYIAGDWDTAHRHFEAALELRHEDKAAKMMIERCERYRAAPPANWDGVSS